MALKIIGCVFIFSVIFTIVSFRYMSKVIYEVMDNIDED